MVLVTCTHRVYCRVNRLYANTISRTIQTRVRFAPSPTGFMHLGSLRTALFNYLYAKKTNGDFLLRIEDTDQKRTVSTALESIISDLKWAGLDYDYGPEKQGNFGSFVQSQRSELYQKYAFELLEKGHAYRCFCTPERLEKVKLISKKAKSTTNYDRHCHYLSPEQIQAQVKKPFVIRFRVPDGEYFKFDDIIHGKKTIYYRTLDDMVLLKSDGLPTYHLANVVDDHLMGITHVIRGEEWLPSTPKHLLLYQAFGWTPPNFAHVPLLLREDGSKLSKRQNDIQSSYFKDNGYLPEALLNFIAFLGWNPGKKKQLYTLPELIEDLSQVQKSGAKVSFKQLDHLNKLHIAHQLQDPLKRIALIQKIKLLCVEKGIDIDNDRFEELVDIVKDRATTLNHFPTLLSPFVKVDHDPELLKEHLSLHAKPIKLFLDRISLIDWNIVDIKKVMQDVAKESDLDFKTLTNILRFVLTGTNVGIGMIQFIFTFGKDNTLARISKFLDMPR